jgi:salicylate hydroxylase
VTVMRAEFQQIMYENALKLGVEIRLGCRIKDIDQSKPSLLLENGELLKADLIVGADGVRSQVRTAVPGENVSPRLENSAYLCTVDGDRMRSDPITAPLIGSIDSHRNTTAWLAPGRHCICSPARWGEFYRMIIMVNQADPRAPYIPADANWNTKGDVQKLRDSFTDHELRFRRVLDLMKLEDCRLWRISTMPDLPLKRKGCPCW